MTENIVTTDTNCWIISDSEFSEKIDIQWFDDKYWLNQGRLLGASSGRGSAWMVKSGHHKMMLRHYYRGGFPAKFNKDKYLWTGLNNTRSVKEYRLLAQMVGLGLPVPKPIAAQVNKQGINYQANILIEYIIHHSTFAGLLNTDSAVENWQKIGSTIATFHQHGINHVDLNAHNILISETEIYLIDFDDSDQRQPKKSWQHNNLKRLKRSIDKLTNKAYVKKNQSKWQQLLRSYTTAI